MAEEIDESGFYRQDFSTVSDWEVFNAQLGDVIQKLNTIEIDNSNEFYKFEHNWKVHTETFLLHAEKFSITLFYSTITDDREREGDADEAKNFLYYELMDVKSTFGPPLKFPNRKSLHAISNLFGLRRFVVIYPHQSNQKHISNPSEFCFFLSAATVVAAEYCRTVPIFVQIFDPKLNIFLGVALNDMLRTNFDIVVLKQSPPECRYLSGLLKMFKEKLPRNNVQPISVSVRNIYTLTTMHFRFPMNVPFLKSFNETSDVLEDKKINLERYLALPSGYFTDSCTEVYLVYSWLDISENIAIDSSLHSDFVPSKAPDCNMFQTANAVSYLTSCLRDFLKLYDNKETLETFVGRIVTDSSDGVNMAAALQHLTDPHIRHIRTNNKLNNKEGPQNLKNIPGPLNNSDLRSFLAFIFPDLYPDNGKYYYMNDVMTRKIELDPHRIKASPLNSLCSRLSCVLATCNSHFGGKSGLVQLWIAFIRDLRFIWNSRLSIQGILGGFPDTRTCLLNQKLQMLNYCIERSKCRKYDNKNYSGHMSSNTDPQGVKGDFNIFKDVFDDIGNEDEDEFYDCTEYIPEGRDKRLGNENILDSNEPLYIPITQDPVPKTEDELQADAENMLKLGSGFNIQMMCPSLLSDMEAFKAANPKGKMEDFIRWYSPKDWETDDSGMGQLSARMRDPCNTWQTVWKQAQPVPASKQKRLFDETMEALNVLSYLETRNIGEIYDLVIISVLHAAILKFKGILETEKILDIFESKIEALLADLCHISRDDEIFGTEGSDIQQKKSKFEDLIKKLEEHEVQFFQYKCFEQLTGYPHNIALEEVKRKFKEMIENLNSCSLNNSDVIGKDIIEFNGGELRSNLIMKEYVLRVREKKAAGPHFLRAIVTGEEVRLCGAFTEDTTFI